MIILRTGWKSLSPLFITKPRAPLVPQNLEVVGYYTVSFIYCKSSHITTYSVAANSQYGAGSFTSTNCMNYSAALRPML